MTYFYVREDKRQIFDARGSIPSDEKMREYSEFYGYDISVIEGTTVKVIEGKVITNYAAQQSVHWTLHLWAWLKNKIGLGLRQ